MRPMIMKQQKIFTLVILLTTFALLWENEKVLSATATEVATSVNANEWIKDNFVDMKCQGVQALTVELPATMHGMITTIATHTK